MANKPKDVRVLLKRGASAILTNRIDVALRAFNRSNTLPERLLSELNPHLDLPASLLELDDGTDEDPATLPQCATVWCFLYTNYYFFFVVLALVFVGLLVYTCRERRPTRSSVESRTAVVPADGRKIKQD